MHVSQEGVKVRLAVSERNNNSNLKLNYLRLEVRLHLEKFVTGPVKKWRGPTFSTVYTGKNNSGYGSGKN